MMMTAVALAMAMAAPKADPQDDARKAFNNCLVEEHNSAVSAKKSGAEFNDQIANACTETRKAYFDIIVRNQKSYGDKQADAEDYANGEVQAIIDSITQAFSDNVGNGAKLEKEK